MTMILLSSPKKKPQNTLKSVGWGNFSSVRLKKTLVWLSGAGATPRQMMTITACGDYADPRIYPRFGFAVRSGGPLVAWSEH